MLVNTPEIYMRRCIELAQKGAGFVAPNPMVGAVLVKEDKIIGEGWHQQYGKAHAEVNAINNAIEKGITDFSATTLYVSLEPCAHFGKTPPCTDLIIQHKIPQVVIGCSDSYMKVNGKGVEKLKAAGVAVHLGVLEKQCRELNKRFFTFHEKHRPYIILKWAQTANKKIASLGAERLLISNEYTNRLVHKWRSEEAAILVGTRTALLDNPSLTNRLWKGKNPIRLVVDKNLTLPKTLQIFDNASPTVVFNYQKNGEEGNVLFYQIEENKSVVQQISTALFQLNIQSLIVEGGAKLLQSYIDEGHWDEARIITNANTIEEGLSSPELKKGVKVEEMKIATDRVEIWKK